LARTNQRETIRGEVAGSPSDWLQCPVSTINHERFVTTRSL
jgi:hypothetical protein